MKRNNQQKKTSKEQYLEEQDQVYQKYNMKTVI